MFASHKLSSQDYLAAIAIYSNAAKGISMLPLSRNLGVQYRTAIVLAHKIHESLYKEEDPSDSFSGEVEIDGPYFLTHVRPENHKWDLIYRRRVEIQNPNKCCVVSIRERGEKGDGATRTKTFVLKSEDSLMIDHDIRQAIETHATVNADQATSYNNLTNYVDVVKRVNHSLN